MQIAAHSPRQNLRPLASCVPVLVDPRDDVAGLDRVGTIITITREQPLFFANDPAECYFKVVKGAVRSCRLLADGRRHIGDFFLPGDFIGLDADKAYPFTAEAVTDTTLIRYSRRKVDALAAQEPKIAKSLVDIMRSGLSVARERSLLLGHMTAVERLASFLLEIADRTDDLHVDLPMTRTDIGDYLGLTMETVSRTFRQLKEGGVIKQRSIHEVAIVDRPGLEEFAGA